MFAQDELHRVSVSRFLCKNESVFTALVLAQLLTGYRLNDTFNGHGGHTPAFIPVESFFR